MKRRDFLKFGAGKTAEAAAQAFGGTLSAPGGNWLRPLFAVAEDDFLGACSRCDACIEACPHGVLFPLPARLGTAVAGTPAMDLLNRGCHLCADWPCARACTDGALGPPDPDTNGSFARVVLARAWIDTDACLPYAGPECGACASSCPVPGALHWLDGTKPVIDPQVCTGCALCREACIVEPKAVRLAAPPPNPSPSPSPPSRRS
ncbi:MAG: hypothetical protein QF926_05060 [Alphaproteobacteria bacterium]|jgi:ferredoxin-type protein NapG|nr:hypothetical protein [Alphaproteobacteria bacterium]MDP6515980.1 hypothetical protein [Alphaproteobacteria bacterium]